MIPILNDAMAQNLGVVIFHAHDHSGPVGLSDDDLRSARDLLPRFQNLLPGRAHASVVIGRDSAAGIVLGPSSDAYLSRLKVRLLGKTLRDLDNELLSEPILRDEEIYNRQGLLTGTRGERAIRAACIAVVGLSGGGSHVVQQLAHMGVGHIVGIDSDRCDASNRSRLIGMTSLDAFLRRRKTKVMARMVSRINRHVRFTGIAEPIPMKTAIDALKTADIVVGCVDSYHARDDIQGLAWRYLIPYVDIGLLIRPISEGKEVMIGGQVITAIPGKFCQWCFGFLSDERLASETGGRPRSYFKGTDKQAQVVSMNGVLASQAVSEVLQILTGFAPVDEEPSIKKYDGLSGTLTEMIIKPNPTCQYCTSVLGAGDLIWSKA